MSFSSGISQPSLLSFLSPYFQPAYVFLCKIYVSYRTSGEGSMVEWTKDDRWVDSTRKTCNMNMVEQIVEDRLYVSSG